MESHLRTVAKALTWRFGGTAITFVVAWMLTGKAETAVTIGIVDTAVKVAAFYFHERLWIRIPFGKKKPPEYQI